METSKISQQVINEIQLPYILKKEKNGLNNSDIELKRLSPYFLLKINLDKIKKDNYKLYLNNSYLYLIFFERRSLNPPLHTHNMNRDSDNSQEYEVMKSIDIKLPFNDFYLIEHYIDSQNRFLKIFLGRVPEKKRYSNS